MKQFGITGSSATAELENNANLWTFANAEIETRVNNTLVFDVSTEALDTRYASAILHADSDVITEVSPDYKPYMEEGCEVAFISKSTTSANRDKVLSSMKSELSDYEYYFLSNGSNQFFLIAFGNANATRTQFYTPELQTSSDVLHIVFWD